MSGETSQMEFQLHSKETLKVMHVEQRQLENPFKKSKQTGPFPSSKLLFSC